MEENKADNSPKQPKADEEDKDFIKTTKLKAGDVFETPVGQQFEILESGGIIPFEPVDKGKVKFNLVFKNYNQPTSVGKKTVIDIYDLLVEKFGEKKASNMIEDFAGVYIVRPGMTDDTYVAFNCTTSDNLQSALGEIFEASIVNQKQLSAIRDLSNRRVRSIFDDFWRLF